LLNHISTSTTTFQPQQLLLFSSLDSLWGRKAKFRRWLGFAVLEMPLVTIDCGKRGGLGLILGGVILEVDKYAASLYQHTVTSYT